MSENNHNKPSFAGKGYYIALILCAAAIGITGYWYYQSQTEVEQVTVQQTQPQVPVGTIQAQQDIPVLAPQTRPTTPSPAQSTAPAQTPPAPETPGAPEQKKVLKTVSPVSGQTITGYSMEALSYNQTTRDWRVHNGVDLAAQAEEPVVCAADGEVTAVFEDDILGHTVQVRHADGYTSQYASLTEQIPVKVGQQVAMGQTIGYPGTSAIVETTLGNHVHFSVTRSGEAMDPAEFLTLGS